eukprot:Hpha_TRINITY_DN1862_c0_g1::TRINITY_DN1862_c0_g1_i1::g.170510::m.170510
MVEPSEVIPGAWGVSPGHIIVDNDNLLVNRLPGEESLGLVLVGMQLQGVTPGSAAERADALRFVGRYLVRVNNERVKELRDVANAAKQQYEVTLGFETKAERDQRRRLRKAKRMLRSFEEEDAEARLDDADRRAQDDVWVIRRHDARVPLGIDLREPGLTVENVRAGSPAHQAGLDKVVGRVVTHVEDHEVFSTADFASLTHGRTKISLRLSANVAGVILKRGSASVPLGFMINRFLEVADIANGSPADAAGMQAFLGSVVTHVDGQPVNSANEIASACRGKTDMFLRFGISASESGTSEQPQDVQPEVQLNGTEISEGIYPGEQVAGGDVILKLAEGDSGLGLQLRLMGWVDPDDPDEREERFCLLTGCSDDSPAQRAGMERMVGMRITHVDGVRIDSPQELVTMVQGRIVVRLRFASPPGPSAHRAESEDVYSYREWISRRQMLRTRAARACVGSTWPIHLLPPENSLVLVNQPPGSAFEANFAGRPILAIDSIAKF